MQHRYMYIGETEAYNASWQLCASAIVTSIFYNIWDTTSYIIAMGTLYREYMHFFKMQ
jgi:hypothetical protein